MHTVSRWATEQLCQCVNHTAGSPPSQHVIRPIARDHATGHFHSTCPLSPRTLTIALLPYLVGLPPAFKDDQHP